MKSYFTVSVKNIEEGRWWTALTSMVSHSGFFHLFNNMLALHVFGTQVCRTIGSTRFLTLYVGALSYMSGFFFLSFFLSFSISTLFSSSLMADYYVKF
jgi:membrane associated rhomboid family serine protease